MANFPMHLALDYRNRLKDHIEKMEEDALKAFEKRMLPHINKIRKDTGSDKLEKILTELRENHQIKTSDAEDLAGDMVNKTKKFSIGQVDDQIESIAGVKPHLRNPRMQEAIDTTINENVRLIKTIPEKYHDEIERVIHEGAIEGKSNNEIANAIMNASDQTTNNATLIARDQVGNVMAMVTKERQTQAGVEHYTWRSVGDNRVRDSHADYDGEKFSWKEGSPEGHPGEPIQCRCIAEPDHDEVLEKWGDGETPEQEDLPPQDMVDENGNIDREAVERQVEGMDFEDEYRYKLDVADESSNKRIQAAKNEVDIPKADKIEPINFENEDYHLVDYMIEEGNTTMAQSRRIPDDVVDVIDEFNNLPDGPAQRDFIDNVIQPRIDEFADDIRTWDKAKGYSQLKQTFEDLLQVKRQETNYMDKVREIVLKKEADVGDMLSRSGIKKKYSISFNPTKSYDFNMEDIYKAENFYKKYANEALKFTTDNLGKNEIGIIEKAAGTRASAWNTGPQAGILNLPSDVGVKTTIHEMGHVVHRHSGEKVESAVTHFFKTRTKGMQLTKIYEDGKEMGYDAFFRHYAGKVYETKGEVGTEIFAMGMPEMYQRPIDFKGVDKEHYNLMYAILKGLF